jgi:hypothetical protein
MIRTVAGGVVEEGSDENGHLVHFFYLNLLGQMRPPAADYMAIWYASNLKKPAKWPLQSAAGCTPNQITQQNSLQRQ